MLNLAANPNAYNNQPVVYNIGGKDWEAYTNTSINQRRVMIAVSPTTSIPSNVLNGNTMDFRLENPIDRIGTVYLRIDYVNSSGANFVHTGPVNNFINQLQIFANNGSTLLYQTIDPVETWLMKSVSLSRNEHEVTAALRGTSATYSTAPITEAAGASGSYYYSVAPNFFRALALRTYSFDGNLLIRFQWANAASSIISGTWTTNNVQLEITGYMEPKSQKELILKRAEVPKLFSYYSPQRHIETLTLAAGSQYTFLISGITGWVNQLYFVVVPVANVDDPTLQLTFTRFASFDILDESSKSVTGYKPQSEDDMIISYSHIYNNLFINNSGAHVWSFSQAPVSDFSTGSSNGTVYMKGYHKLQFTTYPTLVAGTYEITVIGVCNEMLIIKNAQLSTTRS